MTRGNRQLAMLCCAWLLGAGWSVEAAAADPDAKVQPRPGARPVPPPAPPQAPAPPPPAPPAGGAGGRAPAPAPGADAQDRGDPNDRGGTGPKADRAPAKAATGGRDVSEFKEGTPIWIVRQAFRCALDFDESSGFDCYAPLHVENNRNNDNALTHLRRYQWAHFRKWAPTYPLSGKAFALRVTRQVPEVLADDTNEVKFFLASRHRDNPAPITLRREAGAWRIYASSL